MRKTFNVAIVRDEDGYYEASAPSHHGRHTQEKFFKTFVEKIEEAIEL